MTTTRNPYAADLGGADPLAALADTPGRIRALVEKWPDARWAQSYAPGKWNARQVITHLAQTELALGTRARFAATQEGYRAQPFAQDDWLPLDEGIDGPAALDAYTALRRLNLQMFRRLPPQLRDRAFQHPEYGDLTVGWIMAQMAGHDIHHLKQLQTIK